MNKQIYTIHDATYETAMLLVFQPRGPVIRPGNPALQASTPANAAVIKASHTKQSLGNANP
jgi:hypothetical protein